MERRKQTRGKCVFCGREMSRSGLRRHLPACVKRQETIEEANRRHGKEEMLYHLQVQDAWGGVYWLHLEMRGTATLEDLDSYLRAIWLECCGHLSQFSVGGWEGDEIPMEMRVQQVFEPGVELTHIYDFGTSSFTLVQVVGVREGKPLTKHPIFLMARNEPPDIKCIVCGKPASWLCLDCVYSLGQDGTLCEEHVDEHYEEEHVHSEYGEPMPIVNSPRTGMCGYCGPAEPPY